MQVEFLLPRAAAGVKERVLSARPAGKSIKMVGSTNCSTLTVRPGEVVELYDDGVKIEDYVVTGESPQRVNLGRAPCQSIDAPPIPPSGEQPEPSPVQRVQEALTLQQAVGVQIVQKQFVPPPENAVVVDDIMTLSPVERFKRGYRPTDVDGKVVWTKSE